GTDEFEHEVIISRPFCIGAHHVTVGQFKAFVKDTGYKTEAEAKGGALRWGEKGLGKNDPQANWQNTGFGQTDDNPVKYVTWHDAQAFCKWLSAKEGSNYALPTEAQWEFACR